jgi:hypothetical protein
MTQRFVSAVVAVALPSAVAASVFATSLSHPSCDASMRHDCTRGMAFDSCCHATPDVPARVQEQTPAVRCDLGLQTRAFVVMAELSSPNRPAPWYGYLSIDLFTLFSTFLL